METRVGHILNLPLELRLDIYAFILPDMDALLHPSSLYTGLLYSCKAIKLEMEAEFCKNLKQMLETIQERLRARGEAMRFLPPISFHEMRNITIERPQGQPMFMKGDPGLWVSHLRFHRITMKTYSVHLYNSDRAEAAAAPIRTYEEQRNIRNLARHIGKYFSWESTPRFKMLMYDFSESPQTANESLLRDARNSLYNNAAWKLIVGRNESGQVISAKFERISKK